MTAIHFTKSLAEDSAGSRRVYNQFLMLVAGLGGLLYGIDIGIIGGALPYLEATSGLTAAQLSIIVAAVLLGSVISTLFAGLLVDWLGRKPVMILSGVSFIVSIPMIALSHGYGPLLLGRLLQGVSGGLDWSGDPAVSGRVPFGIESRQRNRLLPVAADAGLHCCCGGQHLLQLPRSHCGLNRQRRSPLCLQGQAWRSIFWASLPPGLLFVIGSLFVSESPRWLFKKGKRELALAALLVPGARTRPTSN